MVTCRRFRRFSVIVVVTFIFFLLLYINSRGPCSLLPEVPNSSEVHPKLATDRIMQNGRSEKDSFQGSDFVYEPSNDVLVVLHVQKTSGSTFSRHLVHNAVGFPASCCPLDSMYCNCTNSDGPQWLISRFSTGWVCGQHADWTEFHACLAQTLDKLEHVQRKRRSVSFASHIQAAPADKGKGRTLGIAPQVRQAYIPQSRRSGTWRAPSSVAHTCL